MGCDVSDGANVDVIVAVGFLILVGTDVTVCLGVGDKILDNVGEIGIGAGAEVAIAHPDRNKDTNNSQTQLFFHILNRPIQSRSHRPLALFGPLDAGRADNDEIGMTFTWPHSGQCECRDCRPGLRQSASGKTGWKNSVRFTIFVHAAPLPPPKPSRIPGYGSG